MSLFPFFLLWLWFTAAYAALHLGYRRETFAFLRHPIDTIRRA